MPLSRRQLLGGWGAVTGASLVGLGGCQSGGGGSSQTGPGLSGLDKHSVRWQQSLDGAFDDDFLPRTLTFDNGTLYAGQNGNLYAFDAASGKQHWKFTHGPYDGTAGGYWFAPVVADGTVYTFRNPSSDKTGVLYAVDAATGKQKWSFGDTGGRVLPPAAGAGTVVVSTPNALFALDAATGKPRWNRSHGVYGSPTLSNGLLAVADESGTLGVLDAATGTTKWAHRSSDGIDAEVLTIDSGVVYFCAGNVVRAVDLATGANRWATDRQARYLTGPKPVTVAGGTVYVPGSPLTNESDHSLVALDAATGKVRWAFSTEAKSAVEGPVVVAGGAVYLCATNDVFALDPATGKRRWTVPSSGRTGYGPAAGGGSVFLFVRHETDDPDFTDHLYALKA